MSNPGLRQSNTTALSIQGALNAHPSTAKFAVAMAIGKSLSEGYKKVRGEYDRRMLYALSITEGDALYQDVHNWLLTMLPERNHRKIKVFSGNGADSDSSATVSGSDSPDKPSRLNVYFDDRTEQRVLIEGHRVKVKVYVPEETNAMGRWKPSQIIFEMHSKDAQKAVLKHVERLNRERSIRRPVLKMTGRYGDHWETRSDLPPRTMDSVIINEEQKQGLIDDLDRFLDPATEEFYRARGIPYHRGYMLHGPAGTGKTSLSKALANYFNRDLWAISLAELKNESSLMALISQVPPGSFLLLEDIDSAPGVKKREKKDKSSEKDLTPQALLNALDGVATPHGLVTIMTTNHFEWLDPAMTRAGRMDRIELIDLPGAHEITKFLEFFYREDIHPCTLSGAGGKISQAQVSEICKRHMHDLEGALAEIKDHCYIGEEE